MNRRTFFKRIAATCAGVAAVAVAPAVLVVGEKHGGENNRNAYGPSFEPGNRERTLIDWS